MWKEQNLTCKPLDTLEEISAFMQDPPSWRSLCVELKPPSDYVVKNTDINKFFGKNLLETPQTFCHYDPETEEIERHKRKDLPKTLICHDMANGYHDDRYFLYFIKFCIQIYIQNSELSKIILIIFLRLYF